MKHSIAIGLLLWACVPTAFAQETVRTFSWAELQKMGQSTVGEIQPGGTSGPQEQLRIDNPSENSKSVVLFDIKNPGISTFHYAVEGKIRYENVQKTSYLEMWSCFADGRRFFSRTLGESGPMQSLQGSSDWRPFTLPFFTDKKSGLPTRLIVNIVFAGRGTVFVGPLKIVQYPNGWWNGRAGGWIGGVGGSILGLLGATIGILSGLGKARRFVLVLTTTLAVLGMVSLVVGLVAVVLGQPYAVYYPLLLGGTILAAVFGGNFPMLHRRYQQIELRKMAAMDAG
ncbi:MAG: hypothetical protein LLF97_02660 [Planctomycetaceae bacterium]|nr:hypothetical protein [Planctomycetaceae bacterium]